jgi:hypothetical protein
MAGARALVFGTFAANVLVGAAGCADVLGLDAYRDAISDAGGGPAPREAGGPLPMPAPPADAEAEAEAGSTLAPDRASCAAVGGELFGFDDGADGWHALHSGGTTAQSASFATNCADSLQITTRTDDWYGVDGTAAPLPIALAGIHKIDVDVTTTTLATNQAVALQVGADFHWCQTAYSHIDAGTSTTISVDVAGLLVAATCGNTVPADKSTVRGLWVFLGGGGVYYVDNVRTE